MNQFIDQVREFREAFGLPIATAPTAARPVDVAGVNTPGGCLELAQDELRGAHRRLKRGAEKGDLACLHLACAVEELIEQIEAHLDGDVAGVLDALVDRMYFLAGDVLAFGFGGPFVHPPEWLKSDRITVFAEAFGRVHAANMAKRNADGSVSRDTTGKVIKPPGWVPADLRDLVEVLP